MKKIIALSVIALALLPSCRKITSTSETEGTLSFANFQLDLDAATKGAVVAPSDYAIIIKDAQEKVVKTTTYSAVKADDGGVTLPAGAYTLEARSSEEEVPAAAFEEPVYGVAKDFSITAGQTTTMGVLTCTLLQVKVTVAYDDAFLASVTGAGKTTVAVNPSAPLEFPLTYSNGMVSYDQSAGYFAVNNGSNTTMNVVFSGLIDGKSQKMTANLTGVEPRQWRQIKFSKKVDSQGNATFIVTINSYVDDEDLVVSMNVANEDVIGEDPDAPKGDGGITLAFAPGCTMYNDLSNIVVPATGTMDLRLVATVPGGIKKFIVDMSSTSESFISSVEMTGSTQLDLIHPMESQDLIFSIVPFPHGEDLLGKTDVAFDLSAAQEPILLFPGTHTFLMTITDNNGCKNAIPVNLIVK